MRGTVDVGTIRRSSGTSEACRTDLYGRKFATTNYGMLCTAKGTAALLVPLANIVTTATGSWHAVFYVTALLNVVAAVMALLVLEPMRRRMMASQGWYSPQ
jgi:MFS transporter, OFA family, oxalate/formate antiporter